MSIDEKWLSTWFVDSYIRKCSQICPDNILRLFDDVSTTMKLQNAVSVVVAWRLYRPKKTLLGLWRLFHFLEVQITNFVYQCSLTAPSCTCLMTEMEDRLTFLSLLYSNSIATRCLQIIKTWSQ